MATDWEKIITQVKLPLARPVHPRGILWVGVSGLLALIGAMSAWHVTSFLIGMTVLFYVCFRDPMRVPPHAENIAVAPADGIVTAIDRAPWPAELNMEGEADRVVINPRFYDVHVLRAPVAAALTTAQHIAGQWGSNVFEKSAPGNERALFVTKLSDGRVIAIEIIGGGAAERIRLSARAGDVLALAQPIGFAAFGGEVRIYVPADVEIIAQRGQRMIAGETALAALIANSF